MSKISVTIDGQTYTVEVHIQPASESTDLSASVDGETVKVAVLSLENPGTIDWIAIDNRSYEIVVDRDLHWISSFGGRHRLEVRDLEATITRPASADGRVKAPIPGLITRVYVVPGEQVEAGQSLLVLEAMKMENDIRAPRSGTVSQLLVSAGQGVSLHELMAEIT